MCLGLEYPMAGNVLSAHWESEMWSSLYDPVNEFIYLVTQFIVQLRSVLKCSQEVCLST